MPNIHDSSTDLRNTESNYTEGSGAGPGAESIFTTLYPKEIKHPGWLKKECECDYCRVTPYGGMSRTSYKPWNPANHL